MDDYNVDEDYNGGIGHGLADALIRKGRNPLTKLESSFQSSSSPIITREYLNKISWLDEFYKRVELSN